MMHWILQENLFKESEWENLVGTLERFNIPYSVHKVIPFVGELIPAPVQQHQHVVCFGSYSMRHTAKKMRWTPGVFDLFDQNFEVQLERWGRHMLNWDSEVVRFEDARFPFSSICSAHQRTNPDCELCKAGHELDHAFIRPIDDSKYFAGRVFSAEEFYDWQKKVCVLGEDYGNSLSKDTKIQLSYPKQIYAEYRFWVVDGLIVTASLYKRGDRVIYSSQVDERFHDFVKARIKEWSPHRAFVIDVCDTVHGIKIVEINTINSAGFYAGDVASIVFAIEGMNYE